MHPMRLLEILDLPVPDVLVVAVVVKEDQASRLRVLKYLHIHIRFALIELTQAGRLRSRSYFDHSKISIKQRKHGNRL